jgi:hypothetical protein
MKGAPAAQMAAAAAAAVPAPHAVAARGHSAAGLVLFAVATSLVSSLLAFYFSMQAVALLPPDYAEHVMFMAGAINRPAEALASLNISVSALGSSAGAGLEPASGLGQPGRPLRLDANAKVPEGNLPPDIQLRHDADEPWGYVTLDPATRQMRDSSVGVEYLRTALANALGGFVTLDADGNVPTERLPPDVLWKDQKGVIYAPLGPDAVVAYEYLPDNIADALNFAGTWDPLFNLPYLQSGAGNHGDVYIALRDGLAVLDGNGNWTAGDLALFDNTRWVKLGKVSLVTSVNGMSGVVTLGLRHLSGVDTRGATRGQVLAANAEGVWAPSSDVPTRAYLRGVVSAQQNIIATYPTICDIFQNCERVNDPWPRGAFVPVTTWAWTHNQGFYDAGFFAAQVGVAADGVYMITASVPISGRTGSLMGLAVRVNDNFVLVNPSQWSRCDPDPNNNAWCSHVVDGEVTVRLKQGDRVSIWVSPGDTDDATSIVIPTTLKLSDWGSNSYYATATGVFSIMRVDTYF